MTTIIATYLVHDNKHNLNKKAEGIALGLTIGSWTDLPQLQQEQLKMHKGEVLSTEVFEQSSQETKGLIKISYPSANFSNDLAAILTTVFGKLSLDGKIKLLDLEFSEELKQSFPGPAFGIEGIRDLLQVYNRPLLMSIFKGVIGRDLDYLKEQLREQALGGVDIVKDDEILFDNPLTPLEDRVVAGRDILDQVYTETGHKTLYAVNLTGRTFDLLEKAKRAVDLGADMLLFNVFAYGLDVLQALRENDEISVPIMAHPAVSGAFTASPVYGFSSKLLLGKLLRYAGADLGLFPSPYGSVALERDAALAIAHHLRADDVFKKAFPGPSAGIHPALVPVLFEDFGIESIINAGGGIHGHPAGAVGGGRAFRQAIDATLKGQKLTDAAQEHNELKIALDLWGY